MKRMFSALLAVVLLAGLIPAWSVTAAAADNDLEATVRQQIEAYAKSIAKTNSDEEAAVYFTKFAMEGRGAVQTFDENHHITACLYSSNLLSEALTKSCASLINLMQQTGRSSIYGHSGVTWRSYGNTFSCVPYQGKEKEPEGYLGTLFTMKRLYDSTYCPVSDNAYDETMLWTAGSTNMLIDMRRTAATIDTVTYDVSIKISDRFDFDGDYSKAKGDPTFEKWLTLMGSALGKLMFREYDWSSNSSFKLTVPNTCSHSTGNYHFTYDPDNQVMSSAADGEFTDNPVTRRLYSSTNKTTGVTTSYYYHELKNTIHLEHNKPWVVSYSVKAPSSICFMPVDNSSMPLPYFYQTGRTAIYACRYERVELTDEEKAAYGISSTSKYGQFKHYYGTELNSLFKFQTKYIYTIRIENVIAADGSNMIYVSVFNEDTQEQVLEPTPMNDYYVTVPGGKTRDEKGESNWVSGQDFLINYIGCRGIKFSTKYFDMKIWENGVDGYSGNTFTSKVVAPTCSAEGYTLHTCTLCGATYKTDYVPTTTHAYTSTEIAPTCTADGYTRYTCTVCGSSYDENVVPALGHSLGEWGVTANPTCTGKGTEKRTCATCAHAETRDIAALGHAYDSVVTPPACTTEGYTTHTCTRCGNSYTDSKTAATGHSFGDWTTVTPAGCTTEGLEQRACACGHSESRTLPATGHSHVVTVTEPTCTTAGRTVYTCACGHSYEENYIPATGHSGGEPTCAGLGKCAVCGAYYGKRNPDNHAGGTKVENRVEPNDDTEGYSGDVYCSGCGVLLEAGKVLPAAHSHAGNLTRIEAVEATHESAGNMEHFICTCGKWFADADGAQEIENHDSVIIPALRFAYGDVNHDGDIKISDAILVMKYRAGNLSEGDTFCERCANVKGEGAINIQSAILIMKKRANKNMLFPVELQ